LKSLFLIRHGEPHEGHTTHPHDPPLTVLGRSQAVRVGRRLAYERIDRIVCSPQLRARNTAAPLARRLGLPVQILDGLAEVDLKAGRYRSPATIRQEEPQRWAEFVESPARFYGWDPDAFRSQVLATLEELFDDDEGTRIAVFSHGYPIRTILCHGLGIPARVGFSIGLCSVSKISGTSGSSFQIESINEMPAARAGAVLPNPVR
jgi:2,3-bisphosphoglycerate-dependent phosphoglycerate mutase